MFTIPGHKGNANKNCTKILSHSCWNNYNQKYHQQEVLAKMQGKKEPSYTAGGR
jgi:hypothetical protein